MYTKTPPERDPRPPQADSIQNLHTVHAVGESSGAHAVEEFEFVFIAALWGNILLVYCREQQYRHYKKHSIKTDDRLTQPTTTPGRVHPKIAKLSTP